MSFGGMPEGHPVQPLVKTTGIKKKQIKFVLHILSYQNILLCSNSHSGWTLQFIDDGRV